MYALSDPLFWAYFVYFFLAGTLAFFIPGNLLIRRMKIDTFSNIFLSIVTGFVAWSLFAFIAGYLHVRNLSYVYMLICFALWVKTTDLGKLKTIRGIRIDYKIVLLILLGTFVQLSSIWLNGIIVKDGVYFCCGVPDTLTHLALTSELVTRMPPNEPGFSGIALSNYHYLSNLGIAELVRVFGLPLVATQYQYMTLVFSILLGLSAIALSNSLQLGKRFTAWFAFFLYFAGDVIFLLPFLAGKGINFAVTTFERPSSLWISPPRFYAIIVLFAGLTLFIHWIKRKDLATGILTGIVMGALIGLKVFVSAFILAGFALLGLFYLVKKKYVRLVPIVITFLLSFVFYLLIAREKEGFIFTGFWRFENFVVQDSLGISRLELARRIFLDHRNMLRVFLYDMYFGFLYIVFSAGTLLLGLFQTKATLNKIPKDITILTIGGLVATCGAGFFFVQQQAGADTSQYLISFYIAGTIYAALAVSWWLQKMPKVLGIILACFIILGTATRVSFETYHQVQKLYHREGMFISQNIWNSYAFFNKTENGGAVLLYDNSSRDCLFIIIAGRRSTYSCLSGIPGVVRDDIKRERDAVQNDILFGKDLSLAKKELRANMISYVYIPKDKVAETNIEKMKLPKVYENSTTAIYLVAQ